MFNPVIAHAVATNTLSKSIQDITNNNNKKNTNNVLQGSLEVRILQLVLPQTQDLKSYLPLVVS